MQDEAAEKNGFRVVRGGQYARRNRVEITGPEFWKLDASMHETFVALEDASGRVPSRGIQEIREHRQRPWRVLARRFRELRDVGIPKHEALRVVRTLEQWVSDLWDATPPKDRAA